VTAIAVGDAVPDVAVITIHGTSARLPEARGAGPLVVVPFRGPW
jgi:hypothetical protein